MNALVAVYEVGEEVCVDELINKLNSSLRYDYRDLVSDVMPKNIVFHEPLNFSSNVPTIIVVDCGIKYGILRS